MQLELFAPVLWPCVPGCSTGGAGDERTGITFCPAHGWWPTFRRS